MRFLSNCFMAVATAALSVTLIPDAKALEVGNVVRGSFVGHQPKTTVAVPIEQNVFTKDVGSGLSLANLPRDADSVNSRAVSLPSKEKGYKQKAGAYGKEYCGMERVVPHVLRGFVHRSCGGVRSLLGDKIVYLVLAGFGFSALAGLGGGIILNNFNRNRKWKRLGWVLLLGSLPLFATSFFFGLP